jgi:hypothetical protein
MPTQSWSGKSAVFLMENALTSHGSSKSNKKPSDGRGISDYSVGRAVTCTMRKDRDRIHRGHCIFRRQDMLYCYRNNTHILNGFTHPLVAAQCSCWKLTICPVSKSSTVNFSDHEQLLLAIWCTCKVWYEFADVLLHSQSLTNEWPLNFPPRNISSVPRLPQSVNGTM